MNLKLQQIRLFNYPHHEAFEEVTLGQRTFKLVKKANQQLQATTR